MGPLGHAVRHEHAVHALDNPQIIKVECRITHLPLWAIREKIRIVLYTYKRAVIAIDT